MKNKHIGQLITVKFTDRETPISGFVIAFNDEWTLLKYNPVDYIVDGYLVFRHKNIAGFRRDKTEKWKEKVIRLKGLQPKEAENIPITDLQTILDFLTKKYGVFQIHTKSERTCYLGRLKSIDSKAFVMDDLNPDGQWKGKLTFKQNDVRTIEFDTDYINSLLLVAKARKAKKDSKK